MKLLSKERWSTRALVLNSRIFIKWQFPFRLDLSALSPVYCVSAVSSIRMYDLRLFRILLTSFVLFNHYLNHI